MLPCCEPGNFTESKYPRDIPMKAFRLLVIVGALSIFALATMAPHFHTFTGVRANVNVQLSRGKVEMTPSGKTGSGTANFTFYSNDDPPNDDRTDGTFGNGRVRFQIRCITSPCSLKGEVKFFMTFDGNKEVPLSGQGTLTGDISKNDEGNWVGSSMTLNARVSDLIEK